MSAQGTPTRAPLMSTGRAPLFCDTALAGRIERVEVQLIAQCSEAARRRAGTAGFVIPVAGGDRDRVEPGFSIGNQVTFAYDETTAQYTYAEIFPGR